MHIRILYDSAHGNTRRVAEAMADGLRHDHIVDCCPVAGARVAACDADLLLLGAPTQRRRASDAMRAFLEHLPELHGTRVAAFDTRMDAPVLLTGAASQAIAHEVARHGGRLVVAPESFLVGGRRGPLVDGEAGRAASWARRAASRAWVASAAEALR